MEFLSQAIIANGLQEQLAEKTQSVTASRAIEDTKRQIVRIQYADLPIAVNTIGLSSIIDLYHAVGIVVKQSDEEKEFAALCEAVSDKQLEKIIRLCDQGAFCEPWWIDTEDPTNRVREFTFRQYPPGKRHQLNFPDDIRPELQRVITHSFTAIGLDDLPRTAEVLGVSLRWLLCIPDDLPLFEKRPVVERLYARMKLMPQSRQKIIWETVKGGEEQ